MRTGEGKTLVSTLAAYLNALPGDGVHIVTVNDYLARRDSIWMGQVYAALGLTVGLVSADESDPEVKRAAYAAEWSYGTNTEFGFDYLRDNMAARPPRRARAKAASNFRDRRQGGLDPHRRSPDRPHHPPGRRTTRRGSSWVREHLPHPRLRGSDYEVERRSAP